ncbi:unnamed protein product [Clonostachys rosea f. rosea IK726]|uniref:Uncharacterized protein n=1 Tax=Clonostachys rosea f. rosea IK726 TaxID=1349383 RepID=A0ACA9U9M8_BIOOC|nr:unnamed protein product [Clonostachys rosea f. rosea IK726]
MGGWDVYCALCGGPIRRVWWDADDSPTLRTTEKCSLIATIRAWSGFEDIRLIGENPATASDSKVWLSGPARAEEYGAVSYQNDDPFCAPFHTHCKKLLCKYLGVSELNKEVFLESLKSLAEEGDGGRALDIEYGDIREHMEQYWWPQPGTEHFVCDPVEVKGLAEFYNQLPTRDTSDFGSPRTYNTEGDPFTRLPADVLLMLISLFPSMSDVFSLRIASR